MLQFHLLAQSLDMTPAEADSIRSHVKILEDKDKVDHLILLGDFYGQLETENLDSMRYYANDVLSISERYKNQRGIIEALHLLGKADYYESNYDGAEAFMRKVISLSQETDYVAGLIKGYRKMGSILSWLEKDAESLAYFEKAYKLAGKHDEFVSSAFDVAVDLSIEYLVKGLTEKSSEILLEVFPFVDDSSITLESKGLFYESLGAINQENGTFVNAIVYYEKALDYYRRDNNDVFLVAPLVNMAEAYFEMEKVDEAMTIFLQALEISHLNPNTIADINFGLGYGYETRKEFEMATERFMEAASVFRSDGEMFRLGVTLKHLGMIDLSLNKKSQADDYFLQASDVFKEAIENSQVISISVRKVSDAYYHLSQIDSIRGNYLESLGYYQKAVAYKDSISNKTSLKVAERLELARETAEKNEEIALLESENNVQRHQARQERIMKVVLIIVVSMLILFLVVVVRGSRNKKKALRIIGEKNQENKLLMREIHHRVKNNLQIILSLINAQIDGHRNNAELGDVLAECQNKIQSMAILHQHLYQGGQFASVPVTSYLTELVENIQRTFRKKSKNVEFEMSVDDTDIKTALAVPLGLILNELVTNCYKYAFEGKDGKQNKIRVSFKRMGESQKFHLLIQDNGVGLPDDFNLDQLPSFGMQLVYGLVGQMNGEMKIIRDTGTRFEIYLEEPIAA